MTPRSLRSSSIFTGLACAILALIGWSQPWYSVSLAAQFEGRPLLSVGGEVSAPAVAALALASVAGFVAMAISGRFFRTILALLETILGVTIAFSAILAVASPRSSVSAAVTDATGLAGPAAVDSVVGSITSTAWPYAIAVVGVILAILGIFIVITGRVWPQSGRRYEPVRCESADDSALSSADAAVSDWDELSGGSDPTSH